jgi:CysZ protein
MLIAEAFRAWRLVLSQPMRRVLWRTLALTLALMMLVWLVLTRAATWWLGAQPVIQTVPYLDGAAFFLAGGGLFLTLTYVMPAISALVAGFFLDDIAVIAEQQSFQNERAGKPLSTVLSLSHGARFAGLALLVNSVALMLVFIPGINIIAFFAANAYLLGRAYFELSAARFRTMPEATDLRARNRVTALAAGTLIAAVLTVPVLNLLSPLFGIALMVQVHKRVGGDLPVTPASAHEAASDA